MIQKGTGGIFLAQMIVWVQPWEEGMAMGRDVPPAHRAWGSLGPQGQLREEFLPLDWISPYFSLYSPYFSLHFTYREWVGRHYICLLCVISHCHCSWCSLAQNNSLCNIWCWSRVCSAHQGELELILNMFTDHAQELLDIWISAAICHRVLVAVMAPWELFPNAEKFKIWKMLLS